MPHEPKKRHSRQRQGKRRHAISLALPEVAACKNCGAVNASHTVCATCGFYKGLQVVTPKVKAVSTEA